MSVEDLKNIEIENLFVLAPKDDDDLSGAATLTDEGKDSIKFLLGEYSSSQIKDISGVSRSALKNYVAGANRISKKGQEAIKKLVAYFNSGASASEGSALVPGGLDHVPDKALMEELKRRGYKLFVGV